MKHLYLVLFLSTTIFAATPDTSSIYFKLLFSPADAYVVIINGDTTTNVTVKRGNDGLPETIRYHYQNLSTDNGQRIYEERFSYNRDVMTIKHYAGYDSDTGLTYLYDKYLSVDPKGNPQSCSYYKPGLSNSDYLNGTYHYSNNSLLIKETYDNSCDFATEPDSVIWHYEDNSGIPSGNTAYYGTNFSNDYLSNARFETTFNYKDKKLIGQRSINYLPSHDIIDTISITYDYNSSPILTHSQKKRSLAIAQQQNRIINLPHPEKAHGYLLSPQGRVIHSISFSKEGVINQWNKITSGYYILKVKQGEHSSVLPLIK